MDSKSFNQVAKRPMHCCLDVRKAERVLNIKPLTVEESLEIMKRQEKNLNAKSTNPS